MLVHAGVAIAFLAAQAAGRCAGFQHTAYHLLVRTGPTGGNRSGGGANVGAIEIQANALGQLLDHVLTQAGVGAGCADLGTRVALLNAPDESIVRVALHVWMGANHLLNMHR